jgi:signal transduction histidine kinase
MRRIRGVFMLLAIVLLAPMGLLVQRALDSVSLERRVSHRAIAERLFDEMERELSRLLRTEEERPIDDARFGAEEAAAGEREDFVRGWFEVDSAGRFARPGGQEPGFEALVLRGLKLESASRPAAAVQQAPGTTRELEGDRPEEESGRLQLALKTEKKQVSTYDALQLLNKGARMRSDRQVKRNLSAKESRAPEPEPAALVARRSAPSADADAVAPVRAKASVAAETEGAGAFEEEVARDDFLDEAVSGFAGAPYLAADEVRVAPPAAAPVLGAAVPARRPIAPASVVYPIEGRLIDAEHLLLFRRVERGVHTQRQGVVVALPALFARLDAAALGSGDLASFVDRRFFVAGTEPEAPLGPDGYRYRHRFAEPFDALHVRLDLASLPGVGSANSVYAIAALLLVTGTLGLYAVYRMVAVTVGFAERRSNFVAAVTHELKTPLTAIRMYSEMLRDGMVADDDKRQAYYTTLTAESERLSRLIDNVLEFSRLEQGTRETNLVVGAIGPVVREAAAILEPHAHEVGFRIDVEVAPGLPPVHFDRDAVVQVVFNLVDNALKYARSAGDRVVAIRCVAEGEGVSLRVRDRGPGVSARHVAQIFEPFYRGENELTRTAKGTGIGLALVKGLADAMGAVVEGHNVAEGGFEVSLCFRGAAPG